MVPTFAATIPTILEKVRAKCANFPDSKDLAEQIVARLEKVFTRLLQLCYFVNDAEVVKFCNILASNIFTHRFLNIPTSGAKEVGKLRT
uniref:Uncharacterized protein n=1 Tax=Globisporangium ultimum (strain ATCC 200006 / CBS 805.95 / DAOM BR144) TaxID=431595 RepID=K3WYN5_GLOUD